MKTRRKKRYFSAFVKWVETSYSEVDKFIFIPYIALTTLGIFFVLTASATELYSPIGMMIKQILFVSVGIATAIFIYLLKPKIAKNPGIVTLLGWGTLGLLVVARVFGGVAQGTGAKGWLFIGPFSFQPAELAKISVVLLIALQYARRMSSRKAEEQFKYWKFNKWMGVLVFGMLALIVSMPDIGNAGILFAIILVMIATSGVRYNWMGWIGIGLIVIYFSIPFVIKMIPNDILNSQYQLRRLLIYINPWNSSSQSVQIINSFLAISRGGLFGVGIGNSVMKHYLPEANTDFIVSVIAEEFGLVGVVFLIAGLGIIIYRIFYLAGKTENNYNRIILVGIGMYFLMQMVVNLGGITSVLPLTGVTFPFISYGGTSVLVSSIAIGIVLNISRSHRKDQS